MAVKSLKDKKMRFYQTLLFTIFFHIMTLSGPERIVQSSEFLLIRYLAKSRKIRHFHSLCEIVNNKITARGNWITLLPLIFGPFNFLPL